MTRAYPAIGALALLSSGCFSAELDPDLSGVFVCESEDECSGDQVCFLQRCTAPDELPRVELLNPTQNIPQADFANANGALQIEVSTNLALRPASSEGRSGMGFIEVTANGKTQRIESDDDLSVTLLFEDTTATPLRLAVQAFAEQGKPYPNPEARVQEVLFVDDGRPQVALVEPWPNQRIGLDQGSADFTITTVNFDLMPPGSGLADGRGHAHLYQVEGADAMLPEVCLVDIGCPDRNDLYQLLAPAEGPSDTASTGLMLRPVSQAGPQTVVVTLQQDNHELFLMDPPGPLDRAPVFDSITIQRAN